MKPIKNPVLVYCWFEFIKDAMNVWTTIIKLVQWERKWTLKVDCNEFSRVVLFIIHTRRERESIHWFRVWEQRKAANLVNWLIRCFEIDRRRGRCSPCHWRLQTCLIILMCILHCRQVPLIKPRKIINFFFAMIAYKYCD